MAKNNPRVGVRKATPRRQAEQDAGPDPDFNAGALAQSRLLEAQATIERDYARLRELETRYRFLLQSSTDPIVLIATEGLRILDANPAAATRLRVAEVALAGVALPTMLHEKSVPTLRAFVRDALAGGDLDPLTLRFTAAGTVVAKPALLRQDGEPVLLLRLEPSTGARDVDAADGTETRLARYALDAPDAIVVTNRAGQILQANEAFVELVQATTEKQVRGASLGRWLGRTSVDLGVLLTNLRQRGTLKLFSTQFRAEHGTTSDVEISAAQVGDGDDGFFGFTIRDVGRRLPAGGGRADIEKSVDRMTELVGRVPMKDIVGNTAGLIEQMCIRAALELTRDNRAAAAELLGLSRQSFYVKMRRYKMLEAGAEDEA